ncbi:hypothetical protein [Streptomyces sp. NBC_00582]|uniref:hypothetical protein n=1 Tax=Streptomyces sp. NBC_00582 TaxID=2975783 RepID=UPI002E801CF8|nr:hypothetical protein [Streptomyces sp. NBC_00582]WUB64438.1 hypothetical protein OG852_30620 [Streptomyces sp. NBC_00582]
MPNTPPAPFDRATALTTAQQRAFEHAQAAQKHHAQALEETTYADAHASDDYRRAAVGEARQRAQGHASRTADSARLADMWASVAQALVTGTDGRPTTYDLHVQLDPKSVGEELLRQLRTTPGLGG